jgi:hypothetical protein
LLIIVVVHVCHSKNSHQTHLTFDEPLLPTATSPTPSFRRFANLTLPGNATELSFFRQTVAVATEKTFVIAEPGNAEFNIIPTMPSSIPDKSPVVKMTSGSRPLAMYQIGGNEFLLVYDWGACYVTKCELLQARLDSADGVRRGNLAKRLVPPLESRAKLLRLPTAVSAGIR